MEQNKFLYIYLSIMDNEKKKFIYIYIFCNFPAAGHKKQEKKIIMKKKILVQNGLDYCPIIL